MWFCTILPLKLGPLNSEKDSEAKLQVILIFAINSTDEKLDAQHSEATLKVSSILLVFHQTILFGKVLIKHDLYYSSVLVVGK